jgi:hypothetical protein
MTRLVNRTGKSIPYAEIDWAAEHTSLGAAFEYLHPRAYLLKSGLRDLTIGEVLVSFTRGDYMFVFRRADWDKLTETSEPL